MDSSDVVTVHPDSQNPHWYWCNAKLEQTCTNVPQMVDRNSSVPENHIRFVCLSDTHGRIEEVTTDFVPGGDVVLHAGDFTMKGLPEEITEFNEYLGKLPHTLKIVISGNHELTFDDDLVTNHREHLDKSGIEKECLDDYLKQHGLDCVEEILTNCKYLEDEVLELCGINIYGSPW